MEHSRLALHKKMSTKEEKYFIVGKDEKAMGGRILGMDAKNRFYAAKADASTNQNVAVIGTPGSGVTASFLLPRLYQDIQTGKSFIVTDPVGLVYSNSSYLAANNGYKIRVLNLKPLQTECSDGINLLSGISDKTAEEINRIACIILENTDFETENTKNENEAEEKSVSDCEFNLLSALLFILRDTQTIPEQEKTLVKLYDTLTVVSAKQLEEYIRTSTVKEDAKASVDAYCNAANEIKRKASLRLKERLVVLSDYKIRNILLHDDIDVHAPAKEKCAYYVMISEFDCAKSCLITSLFYHELLTALFADPQPKVDVDVVMSDLETTGVVSDLFHLSNSDHISVAFTVDGIRRLKNLYPDSVWQDIMRSFGTRILLHGADDKETDQYFADLIDGTEILTTGETMPQIGRITADMLRMMTENELLVNSDKYTIVLEKYHYWVNALYNQKQTTTTENYVPVWKREEA